ncbi:MAG: rod shape-determining protein MreD [Alphaproteobacteria bacterium]|nr:rod shape-determining protein MreD [Alphaproteobacteria bacterium]
MRQLNARFLLARSAPFLLCIVLILLNQIPYHFLPYYPYAIQWVLIPVFYFSIYNPKVLSVWAVFLLGLFTELFVQSPCGVITFSYVLMYFVGNFFRKYLIELTFIPLWGIFSVGLILLELLTFALIYCLAIHPVSIYPIAVETVVLVLVYPFLMRFFGHLDRKAREVS